jgi:hypothetical protein
MVFDAQFAKKTAKKNFSHSLQSNDIRPIRISTTSTPRSDKARDDVLIKMKNSPYLAHRIKNHSVIG